MVTVRIIATVPISLNISSIDYTEPFTWQRCSIEDLIRRATFHLKVVEAFFRLRKI